jgi:sigma-B regulation protein RsbU (phosphoserine phosphatase)
MAVGSLCRPAKRKKNNMAKADILIVDDTPTNLSLLTQMLTSQGYSVRAVTNGQRALESARTLPPDLILLDIRMPGVNGFDVCQQLKSDELTHEIPVIFISALDDIQDKVRGFKAGGVDYITKPFQLEEVLARTETHLAMRTLQRQLQEANRKMATELTLAGQMQANFMPKRLPTPPGWQLSAGLKPARETSGDFFDVFHLPDGKLAILIADVVDKGVGAALFMAYTWSLIRTFADERPSNPSWVYNQVNRRILADTGSDQFVTIFYAVLEPASGKLVYCNAGHLPPLLFRSGSKVPERRLVRTGIPLGVYDDQAWGTESLRMTSGDLLVMYTDGTVDAINSQEQNFGDKRLVEAIGAALAQEAVAPPQVQEVILKAIQDFTGDAQQFDDMALVLLQRS